MLFPSQADMIATHCNHATKQLVLAGDLFPSIMDEQTTSLYYELVAIQDQLKHFTQKCERIHVASMN